MNLFLYLIQILEHNQTTDFFFLEDALCMVCQAHKCERLLTLNASVEIIRNFKFLLRNMYGACSFFNPLKESFNFVGMGRMFS